MVQKTLKEKAAGPGRPRKSGVEAAVLDAVVTLVRAHGATAVTTQKVADAAGVGRQTVYRRWPRREMMLVDALVMRAAQATRIVVDELPPGREIESVCDSLFLALNDDGRLTCDLLALIRDDASAQNRVLELVVRPWIAALLVAFNRAAPDNTVDQRLFAFMLQAALVYHLQLGGTLGADVQARCCAFIRAGLGMPPAVPD